MATIDISSISTLANTSWEIDYASSQEVQFTPSDAVIDFGDITLEETSAVIECDRHEYERSQTGGELQTDIDEFGNLENIKFMWKNARQRVVLLDLTGSVLTVKYSDDYSETYNQL